MPPRARCTLGLPIGPLAMTQCPESTRPCSQAQGAGLQAARGQGSGPSLPWAEGETAASPHRRGLARPVGQKLRGPEAGAGSALLTPRPGGGLLPRPAAEQPREGTAQAGLRGLCGRRGGQEACARCPQPWGAHCPGGHRGRRGRPAGHKGQTGASTAPWQLRSPQEPAASRATWWSWATSPARMQSRPRGHPQRS